MAKKIYKGHCRVDGCTSKIHASFLCNLHYYRKRNGLPMDKPAKQTKPRQPIDRTGTKFCTGCERDLPKTEFHGKSENKDGLMTRCKACRARSKGKGQARTYYEMPEEARVAARFNSLPAVR